jgi:hypothetical protein
MEEYRQRELLAAPDKLVSGGKFIFGTYNTQFRWVNPLEARCPLGAWITKPLLPLRLKEWQAFQLGNERWFILAVLYNARFSGLAQFIAYDKVNKKKYVFDKTLMPWAVNVPPSIWDGRQSYVKGGDSIEIISRLEMGRFYVDAKLQGTRDLPAIDAHFEAIHEDGMVEPIVVSIPFGANCGMYSHKCLMPMRGRMSIGGEAVEFKRDESFAIIDDHKGFYPYIMHYDWATAAGFNSNKQLTGFNLTDNQSTDAEKYNENCLWIDGRLHLLPPVKFKRPDGVNGAWQIKDKYGMVNLVFQPVSMQKINIRALVIRVSYYGPFGYFSGYIKDRYGVRTGFDNYFGMGEQKYVRG